MRGAHVDSTALHDFPIRLGHSEAQLTTCYITFVLFMLRFSYGCTVLQNFVWLLD